MTDTLYVICECTPGLGTQGFRVTSAVASEDRAQRLTDGLKRFYVTLERDSTGDYAVVARDVRIGE